MPDSGRERQALALDPEVPPDTIWATQKNAEGEYSYFATEHEADAAAAVYNAASRGDWTSSPLPGTIAWGN
jgi:hypothetical protein